MSHESSTKLASSAVAKAVALAWVVTGVAACEDDQECSGPGAALDAIVVQQAADLPSCSGERTGQLAYVQEERKLYACLDEEWLVAELDGLEGPIGPEGPEGPRGADGAPGMAGPQGVQGPAGADGAAGATGPQGAAGADGAAGAMGPRGPAGADGAPGSTGPQGPPGKDGLRSLVQLVGEPAGINCAAGGQLIRVGLDDNGSGALDPDEVDSTSYVCDGQAGSGCGVVQGSFTIQSALDIAMLAGCTGITGNLTIGGAGLTNLAGLEALTSVGGALTVQNATSLGALNDLKGLKTLGSLRLYQTPALFTVGLPNLTSISGDFVIESNPFLTSLGLPRLQTVGGTLMPRFNDRLTSFVLPALTDVATLSIGETTLTTVSLPSLAHVGSLQLSNRPNLQGFEALASVNSLTISTNPTLTSVAGLSSLDNVQSLSIYSNPELTTLEGLASLKSARSVSILLNPKLTDLQGLGALTISDDLQLQQNQGLVSLAGLKAQTSLRNLTIDDNPLSSITLPIASISGTASFGHMPQLTSVDLGSLSQVAGHLKFSVNAQLATLSLPALVSVGGILEIDSIKAAQLSFGSLQSIGALELVGCQATSFSANALATVTGSEFGRSLRLRLNPQLVTLQLGSLTSVPSLVEIHSNLSLPNLSGLSALRSIGTDLLVYSNAGLNTLGLSALTSVGGVLQVSNNPALPQCYVDSLATQLAKSCTSCSNNGNGSCQ
jgi:hypothetical protein